DVDVRPVRLGPDRCLLRAELLEGLRRDRRGGAVRAVDGDTNARQGAAKPLCDVLQVAVGIDLHAVDLPVSRAFSVEQALDLFLIQVGQLLSVPVDDLDPVVSGRVVRGRAAYPEAQARERDRWSGRPAGQHGIAAG